MAQIDDPIILYLVVNKDLEMGKGKVAAQVGHAVQAVCEHYLDGPINSIKEYRRWSRNGSTKIVLSATTKEFNNLKKFIPITTIRDAGHTQVDPGTETVMAFTFFKKSQQPEYLSTLKLY